MAKMTSIVRENGDVVCRRCTVADGPLERMRGLLGRTSLDADEGLLLRPASSIHTWFMQFPIDAVFLDDEYSVVTTRRDLGPWHTARARGARAVLELPAGAADELWPGDRLILAENDGWA